MTNEDRVFLTSIRDKCDDLAKDLKKSGEMGYVVGFNLNGQTGETDNWSVKQMIDVNIDRKIS